MGRGRGRFLGNVTGENVGGHKPVSPGVRLTPPPAPTHQLANAANHVTTQSSPASNKPPPIRVAPKVKSRKRPRNVFQDDRGYPDQSDELDHLLHDVDGGPILRKRRHLMPSLDDIDPAFNIAYDEQKHGEKLKKELKISHLPPDVQELVRALVIKYWAVFDDSGLHIPVKDYECEINTGNARPIAVKKINYGPKESIIMDKAIAALAKLGHIRQIQDGRWLFKGLLAPKPHQEHITDIEDFVWKPPTNMCLQNYFS